MDRAGHGEGHAEGHGPCFFSVEKCQIHSLAVGGRDWPLPSAQGEGSRQLPGPCSLQCPLNCGKPGAEQSRAEQTWPPSTEPKLAGRGMGTLCVDGREAG